MSSVTGIHHITCIAGDPQENVDFYTRVLGMRLVKKSVNQDVPDTYHLFYADGEAHPGADLTFFPWPKLPPVQKGVGLAVEVSLAIPAGAYVRITYCERPRISSSRAVSLMSVATFLPWARGTTSARG